MKNPHPPEASRRAFFRACVRYPVAGALAWLGVGLALRQADPSVAACLKQRFCRGCAELPGCTLPQARVARQKGS